MNDMFDKLAKIKTRFEEVSLSLTNPQVFSNRELFISLSKEHSESLPIVQKFEEYESILNENNKAKIYRDEEYDPEIKQMFQDDIIGNEKKLKDLEEELKQMLLPGNAEDSMDTIIEIRAGAGGEEAGLFALNLKRCYEMFATSQGLIFEDLGTSFMELGGIRESTFEIKGKGAFSLFKFESGVHRVQRVPDTESSGRIHTSTVTVAVLPENPDIDLELKDDDLQIDTYRSGGAGGQHVNKTESAIRITHIPTGIVVTCQDERSQIKNKEKAILIMKNRIFDFYQSKADAEYAEKRRTQIGTGDRCEKIRTYNYPQNRVTDHRINFSMFSIEEFMQGKILAMIEQLQIAEKQARLSGEN